MAAASLDVAVSDAQRYPRLGLSGSIGAMSYNPGGVSSISQPGRSARWRCRCRCLTAGAGSQCGCRQSQIRRGHRLVPCARAPGSARSRGGAGQSAKHGGAKQRHAIGRRRLPGCIQSHPGALRQRTGQPARAGRSPPDSTRASIAVLSLERERQLAWVALYRAAGGGWQMPTPARATGLGTPTVTTDSNAPRPPTDIRLFRDLAP